METPFPFPTETQLSQDLLRLYRGLLEETRTRLGADTIFDLSRRVDELNNRPTNHPHALPAIVRAAFAQYIVASEIEDSRRGAMKPNQIRSGPQLNTGEYIALRDYIHRTEFP